MLNTMSHSERRHAKPVTNHTPDQIRYLRQSFSDAKDEHLTAARCGPHGGPPATPYAWAKECVYSWADAPFTRAADSTTYGKIYTCPLAGSVQADAANHQRFDGQPAVVETVPLGRCGVTGAWCWGDAVVALLSDANLCDQVLRIVVRRGDRPDAGIFMKDGRVSRFCADADQLHLDALDAQGHCAEWTFVGGAVLAALARELAAS